MATIPTPEQGKPILDFSAGTFDGSSNLFQSRNGATEHVSGDDVADYVNTSRIYNGLDTTAKTPVGAINEINRKDASDISYDNTESGFNANDVQGAIDELEGEVSASMFSIVRNDTTYTFRVSEWISGDFYSFLLYGGTNISKPYFYICFISSTGAAVSITPVVPYEDATISGTFDPTTKTMTITSDKKIWGGINVIICRRIN